jgi:hypothetical protein
VRVDLRSGVHTTLNVRRFAPVLSIANGRRNLVWFIALADRKGDILHLLRGEYSTGRVKIVRRNVGVVP